MLLIIQFLIILEFEERQIIELEGMEEKIVLNSRAGVNEILFLLIQAFLSLRLHRAPEARWKPPLPCH